MKYLYISFLISLLVLLSSCTGAEPEASAVPSETPTPVPSTEPVREPYVRQPDATSAPRADAHILHLSMRPPVTLNPLLNTDPTVDAVLKLIYEPLVVLDETLKPSGNLVVYRFSSDYTSVNLTIRNDAIWSDGTPVTAADVIHSIETIRSAPEDSIYKYCVQNIASWEEISNKLVKITFNEVYGGSPYMLAFPLIPAHHDDAEGTQPLGDGLYSLETLTPNDRLTLVKSPYTFRAQAGIEKIEVLFLPDHQTELYAFDQGVVDVVSMEISEWMEHHSVKPVRYGEYPAMYFDFIGFNYENPLVSRAEFREAVACSFDIDEAVADIYLDHALRAATPINPASWAAANPEDAINNSAVAYDADKARRLFQTARQKLPSTSDNDAGSAIDALASGGAALADDVSSADNGAVSSVSILVNEENGERVKIAGRLAEGMNAAGMPARVEPLPFEEFSQKLTAGDFEIVVGSYSLSAVPDLRFAFHSRGIDGEPEDDGERNSTGGRGNSNPAEEPGAESSASSTGVSDAGNFMGYRNLQLDILLDTAAIAFSEIEYRRALTEIQEFFINERPVVGVAFRKSAVITGSRVLGDLKPSPDNPLANINEWMLEAPAP